MKCLEIKIAFLICILMFTPIIMGSILFDDKTIANKEISLYNTNKDIIEKIDIEDYIIGVVSAEMPAEFHLEALKAQAVTARTYLVNKEKCELKEGADICDNSSHCQAFMSKESSKKNWGKNFNKYYSKIKEAVMATEGEIVTYKNEPISAVFHSTSSGRTENAEDVWGNSREYLKSVECEEDLNSLKYNQTIEISLEEFINTIKNVNDKVNFDLGYIGDITYTEGGSVDYIVIGNEKFKGVDIRQAFSLNSANFNIDINNDKVTFTVKGYGHGVGMSQYGANFMAQDGKNYKDIINKFYTDVEIEKISY